MRVPADRRPRATSARWTATPRPAMRYTEARMTGHRRRNAGQDLEYDTVDRTRTTFDGTGQREPTVLPSQAFRICWSTAPPASLVGMATNLAPHNLNEICDAIVALIDNPEHRAWAN